MSKVTPSAAADKLLAALTPNFVPQQDEVEGYIESVEYDGKGRAKSAKATIGGKPGRNIQVSLGMSIQQGDRLGFKLVNGSLVNGVYEVTRRIESDNTNLSPNKNRPMPIIEITGASATTLPGTGGIVSLQKTQSNSDPSGDTKARALIPYRTIIESQYSLLDEGITNIAYRYRIQGETDYSTGQAVDWYQQQQTQVYPTEYVHVTVTEPVTFDDLTLPIAIPTGLADKIIYNQALWWKLEKEIIIGYINIDTPTVLNVIQRAVEGTTAAAHGSVSTSPAQPTSMAVLLNGLLTLDNLRPSTQYANVIYEIQLAPIDSFSFQGQWSETYSFTVWKKTDPPPAPTDFQVSITRDGYKLSYRKVPREDVRYYQIFRYSSAPTSSGVPVITSAQTMPGAGSVGDYPGLIEGNQISWPVNQYSGNGYAAKYFCIRAIDNSGNPGVFTPWTTDTTPPPNPDPTNVTIQATVEGPKIIIASTDTSDRDEGFATWVLWQATSSAGASKAVVARFKDRQFTYREDPAGLQYYQVTSEDLIGNNGATTDNATYWKRDDGVPSAPAGLAVVAIQGGFRLSWTRPSYAQLDNISHLVLRRAKTTNGTGTVVDKIIDKNQDNLFWPAMEVPIADIASLASYLYFFISAVDYNGTSSGFSAYAADLTAPAAPSPANVQITSDRGGIKVNISLFENPQLDDSWKEYLLIGSTVPGVSVGNLGALVAFDAKTTRYEATPYSNDYYQVISRDWVGNYSAINPSNWVQAQALYPTDPRQLLPANGDFQEINPATPTLPLHWGFTGVNGQTVVATSYPISTISHIKTGGSLDSAYVGGLLGAGVGAGTNVAGLHMSTLFPYNQRKTYNMTGWMKLPANIIAGGTCDFLVDLLAYTNTAGTGVPTVYHHVLRYTNSSGVTVAAGTWVPSDVTNFVPNITGTYARLVFIAMYNSAGTNLNGTTWGLDDILLQAVA